MVDNLLSFDCENQSIERPEYLSVRKHALPLIKKLLTVRPMKKLYVHTDFDPMTEIDMLPKKNLGQGG